MNSASRKGVIAGAVGLALAVTMVRFGGAVSLPAKPPPPSESLATSRDALRTSDNTARAWVAYLDKDALTAGVAAMTPQTMARKLVARVDEAPRSLAPGEPGIVAAGLKLTASVDDGTLQLVIENQTKTALAYLVVTQPRPAVACSLRDLKPYNANVIQPGEVLVRNECGFRRGMALDVGRVETIALAPLQAYYVSKVPPRALGADARVAVGHSPDLPGGQAVCNIAVSQSLKSGIESGAISWRDLVDFYARHRCETYRFPLEYKAFTRDGERSLPASN